MTNSSPKLYKAQGLGREGILGKITKRLKVIYSVMGSKHKFHNADVITFVSTKQKIEYINLVVTKNASALTNIKRLVLGFLIDKRGPDADYFFHLEDHFETVEIEGKGVSKKTLEKALNELVDEGCITISQ